MKFLISLALIVVLASAHDYGSMFKPARSCEQNPEQVVEKTESMLNQLQEVVSKVCSNKDGSSEDSSSEDSESEDVEATLLALEEAVEGELEKAEEKDTEMGDKRDKVERGRHFDGVVDFLTEEKCAEDVATVAQELLEKFQQEKEARDPCNKSVTFAEFQTQITERCDKDSEKDGDFVKDEDKEVDNGEVVKDEDKEVVVDDGEEKDEVVKDEEEVVAGTLERDGKEKGEGKGDRKDKESHDCDKLTEEELKASWTTFFSETDVSAEDEVPADDAVSGVQYDLGVRKMKVMNHLQMAFESNCVKPEVELEDKPVVEGEEETVKDEEKEAETTGFQRRLLYRDGRPGDRHGEKDAEKQWGDKRGEHDEEKQWGDRRGEHNEEKQWEDKHGEQGGEKRWEDKRGEHNEERHGDRHGERDGEKKEDPAMELVAAFKTECVPVTHESVNNLFDEVQAVMEAEKADREQENQDKETEKDESELVADKETEKDEAEVVAEKETEQKEEETVSLLADVSDAQEKLDEAVAREVDVSQEKSEENYKSEEKVTDMRSFRQEMMRRWEEMRTQREAADKDVDSEGKTEEKSEEQQYRGRERGEKSDENKSEEKSQGSRRERQRRGGNSRRWRVQWGRRRL